jgi:hypothetical protein
MTSQRAINVAPRMDEAVGNGRGSMTDLRAPGRFQTQFPRFQRLIAGIDAIEIQDSQ